MNQSLAELDPSTDYRLRISIAKSGKVTCHLEKLQALPEAFCKAILVPQNTNLQQPFTYFKTSYRPHLDLGQQEQIYYNAQGQLLESSIGNLVLQLDGHLYTPPVELGLLNGIYRQHLLATGQATEKILSLDDLKSAERIYACNALRGLYELEIDN